MLKLGSTGNEVRKLQKDLTSLRYYSGEIDGVFGQETKRAVQMFQTDHHLTPDGIVGSDTKRALHDALDRI